MSQANVSIADRPSWMSTIRRYPDLLAVGICLMLCAAAGFARREYAGDGMRHLEPILLSSHPKLGEPRWLLFPGLLFFLLRPFVSLGLVSTVEGLTRPMMAATLAAAAVYLFALRACLRAAGCPPVRRGIALLLAFASAGLLFIATDLMEPLFAAAFAIAGLAYAAKHNADPAATVTAGRRATLVAIAAIAVASLLYQGLILALAFVPLVVPWRRLLERQTLVGAALIIAAVPLVTTASLMLTGNSVSHAVARFAQGEENPLYRSYLKQSGVRAYLVALLAGPPQGLLVLPNFKGLAEIVAGLRGSGNRSEAFDLATRLGLGFLMVAGGVFLAIRKRQVWLLIAFAALLVLPIVRHQQYGYIKFYVLLPVLLAIGAAKLPARVTVPVLAAVVVFNGTALVRVIRSGRGLYNARRAAYAQADSASCWISTGWGPRISTHWPGSTCGILSILSGGSGANGAEVIGKAHAALTDCLQHCFCGSSAVFTDDMTERGMAALSQSVTQFRYTDLDLAALTIPSSQARLVSAPGAAGDPVYAYPPDEQRKRCKVSTR